MKKISVIIPYYNSENYIEECLKCLELQTYKNFEVILIDDGSNDQSTAIIDEMMVNSELSIRTYSNERNMGVAFSRNRGIQLAEGEWLYFLDSDDTISAHTFEKMVAVADGYDGVIAPISKFTIKKKELWLSEIDMEVQTNETNPTAFLRKGTVCGILYRKSLIDQYGIHFNEAIEIFPDWSFAIEYQKHVHSFMRILTPGFYYRGEVYDPILKPNLSRREFDEMFKWYCESYYDNFRRSMDIRVIRFLDKKMVERVKRYFNPDSPYIEERYERHGARLHELFQVIRPQHYNDVGRLFQREIKYLKRNQLDKALKLNKNRKKYRVYRRIALNRKSRSRSLYDLNVHRMPVDEKTIVFESFAGKGYSDSPKYIYEKMYKEHPEFTYYWVLNQPDDYDIPGPAIKVKRLSKEFYRAYATAKFWVSNARIPLYLIKKPGQIYIQTWHGTPLKRLGNDMKVVRMPGTTTPAYKYNFKKETDRWDYLVSPNRYSSEIFKSAFWMDEERIIESGYPRNDILTTKKNDTAFINDIKRRLGIPLDKKVIMYAPTWRDDEFIKKGKYRFELKIDLENLEKTIGHDTIILLRMHYLVASAMNISDYQGFAYDVSSYPDISELYLVTDLLITDYSSVFFDFGILNRPQVFFSYDLAKYKDDLRGFYLDYYKDLPGPIYEDAYSMAMVLKDIDTLESKYKSELNRFHERFCRLEDGHAAERIVEKMIELTK